MPSSPRPLTHPVNRHAPAVGVAGYANALTKIQPSEASAALIQTLATFELALNQLSSRSAILDDFQASGLGVLKADTLALNNSVPRFLTFDAAPITYITTVNNRIIPLGSWQRLSNTSGGSLTLTSTPTIAPGKEGQVLFLVNLSNQNLVVQDIATLAGSGLRLKAGTFTIAQYRVLQLIFSVDLNAWLQIN